jgi:hypothetical protein
MVIFRDDELHWGEVEEADEVELFAKNVPAVKYGCSALLRMDLVQPRAMWSLGDRFSRMANAPKPAHPSQMAILPADAVGAERAAEPRGRRVWVRAQTSRRSLHSGFQTG